MENVNLFNLSRAQLGKMERILKHGVLFDSVIFLEICLKVTDTVHKETHTHTHHNAIYYSEKLDICMSNPKG